MFRTWSVCLPERLGPLSPEFIEAGHRIFTQVNCRPVLTGVRIGDPADKPDSGEQLLYILAKGMVDVY